MRLRYFLFLLLVGFMPTTGAAQVGRPLAPLPPERPSGAALSSHPQTEYVSPAPVPTVPEPAGRPEMAGGMSLADVEQMALGANPSLGQAAARVEAARGRQVQVGLYPIGQDSHGR